MSGRYDFDVATSLVGADPPFEALIMAAAMKADAVNLAVLNQAFPDLVHETRERYNAPGRRIPDDGIPL